MSGSINDGLLEYGSRRARQCLEFVLDEPESKNDIISATVWLEKCQRAVTYYEDEVLHAESQLRTARNKEEEAKKKVAALQALAERMKIASKAARAGRSQQQQPEKRSREEKSDDSE